MNKIRSVAIVLILFTCFTSCFTGRKLIHKNTGGNDTTVIADTNRNMPVNAQPQQHEGNVAVTPVPHDTIAIATPAKDTQLIGHMNQLWRKRLVYNTFKGKAKIRFDGPDNKQEFTAIFRVKKDSLLWINVVALGLQVARILITPDSLYMINYLQEEVTYRSLNDASKILPAKVDFSSLQNLLTGEPFREGQITDADTAGSTFKIKVEDSSYIQNITYDKTDSTITESQLLTKKPKGPEATETYRNYEPTTKGKISSNRELTIKNGNDNYFLKMVILKSEFDEDIDFPFSIPSSYSVK